jgi:hypothetical protein
MRPISLGVNAYFQVGERTRLGCKIRFDLWLEKFAIAGARSGYRGGWVNRLIVGFGASPWRAPLHLPRAIEVNRPYQIRIIRDIRSRPAVAGFLFQRNLDFAQHDN